MSIIVDPDIPAAKTLLQEGITVYRPGSVIADARIAFINLMPVKTDTELDFMRLLGSSDFNVEIVPVNMATHTSRHTPSEHIDRFYRTFQHASQQPLHGIIITGAPLENVAFEDVTYWNEITSIFDYTQKHNIPALYICWSAFAVLYHRHGIPMQLTNRKISGIYTHRILDRCDPLMKNVSDGFHVPHSRYAIWNRTLIESCPSLHIVADSQGAGIYMAASDNGNEYFIVGHGEYSTDTLDKEYRRDMAKGIEPSIPSHYYPDDNPDNKPVNTWHGTAVNIFHNWLHVISRK